MLAAAAEPLGVACRFYDPSPEAPAAAVGEVVRGPWDDVDALAAFSQALDAMTWEFENVPIEAADAVARRVPSPPSRDSLRVAQDRREEKALFARLQIPAPAWDLTDGRGLGRTLLRFGRKARVKTCQGGYDGRGQATFRPGDDVGPFAEAHADTPLLVEEWLDLRRELSVLVCRGEDGEVRTWPVTENLHVDGILHRSIAPAPHPPGAPVGWACALAEALEHRGVLALEVFDTPSGLLANEIAPRVHNSGHWTQDGAQTCQFTNHVRAALGLPLGPTGMKAGVEQAAMLNLVGVQADRRRWLQEPVALHWYGKQPRPRRKVGHLNLVGAATEVARTLSRLDRPDQAGLREG
jgi:5-(carboxyamino)imidazole ribonucleotide synthase